MLMTFGNPAPALFLGLTISGTCLAYSPVANAQGFTLGQFDIYGILVNNGASGGDINTAPVNANIGVGNMIGGTINLHNEVVNGAVNVGGTAASNLSNYAITGTQPVSLGGAPTPAAVNSNVASVSAAITTANNLSTSYGSASELALATTVSINTGSQTINASSGGLDGTGTEIFKSSTFAIGNGNTLTINGTASQYVVIDITGTSTTKLDGALTLTGGISADHVLINFIGIGGSLQGAANGATLQGTFLVPNMAVTLNSLTIAGRIFGGSAGHNFQFVSNALIIQPAISQAELAAPEPGSVAVFGVGLLGLIGIVRANRFKTVSASA